MKKITTLFTLLLCVVLALSSCDIIDDVLAFIKNEPETAEELFEYINESMNSLESYEMDGVIKFSGSVAGIQMEMSGTNESIEYGIGQDYYYSYSKTSLTVEANDTTEKQIQQTIYEDGIIYLLNSVNGIENKICSEMSIEELNEYKSGDISLNDADLLACVTKEMLKNEDGTWKLTLSGYTNKVLDKFVEGMNFDNDLIDIEFVDMTVDIVADSEYKVLSMSIDFDAKYKNNTTSTPEFACNIEYSNHNEVDGYCALVGKSEYAKCASLMSIKDVGHMLDERMNEAEGNFNLITTQKLVHGGSLIGETEEHDLVRFQNKNGTYTYDIKATANGITLDIKYSGINQIVEQNGQVVASTYQSQDIAKQYIDLLINSARFSENRISWINIPEQGKIVFKTRNADESLYKPLFASMGMANYKPSTEQEITFTIIDGKITKIYSTLEVRASIDREMMRFYLTSEVTFND